MRHWDSETLSHWDSEVSWRVMQGEGRAVCGGCREDGRQPAVPSTAVQHSPHSSQRTTVAPAQELWLSHTIRQQAGSYQLYREIEEIPSYTAFCSVLSVSDLIRVERPILTDYSKVGVVLVLVVVMVKRPKSQMWFDHLGMLRQNDSQVVNNKSCCCSQTTHWWLAQLDK